MHDLRRFHQWAIQFTRHAVRRVKVFESCHTPLVRPHSIPPSRRNTLTAGHTATQLRYQHPVSQQRPAPWGHPHPWDGRVDVVCATPASLLEQGNALLFFLLLGLRCGVAETGGPGPSVFSWGQSHSSPSWTARRQRNKPRPHAVTLLSGSLLYISFIVMVNVQIFMPELKILVKLLIRKKSV